MVSQDYLRRGPIHFHLVVDFIIVLRNFRAEVLKNLPKSPLPPIVSDRLRRRFTSCASQMDWLRLFQ
jgi:hypothetical protein